MCDPNLDTSSADLEFQLFMFHMLFYNLYNIGFAAIQITHLSVIPTSSADDRMKDLLVSYRCAFIFISGFVCMLIASYCITMDDNLESALMMTAYVCSLVGLMCSIF